MVVMAILGGRWLIATYYPLKYRESLYRYAAEYELDPYLVAAVIRTESKFKPDAVSRTGARGLMQIMPDTGEWIARQMGIAYAPEMLYDPDYNIKIGCWYLADLSKEFHGDVVMTLAAYNGGRTNVQQWVTDREWTGQHETLDQIPFKETRLYVAQVMRDRERYHLIYTAKP